MSPSALRACRGTAIAVVAVTGLANSQGRLPSTPELILETPQGLSDGSTEVGRFDHRRLSSVMTLTGLADPGPAIRVRLLAEDTTTALDTPQWIAGFADADNDLVVLFPDRIGSYPFGSIESVLYHEVAHILIGRAAGGGRVPRWFNEGLASAAERTRGLEARSRLGWELLIGGPVTATELEGLFSGDAGSVRRAYVLSEALVRDILERHGPQTAARVLSRMSGGMPFDLALMVETGVTVEESSRAFWSRRAVWERWIAFIGHPLSLWGFVTLLALVAIWRHRRKRRARHLQWEREEREELQRWEEHRSRYRVH